MQKRKKKKKKKGQLDDGDAGVQEFEVITANEALTPRTSPPPSSSTLKWGNIYSTLDGKNLSPEAKKITGAYLSSNSTISFVRPSSPSPWGEEVEVSSEEERRRRAFHAEIKDVRILTRDPSGMGNCGKIESRV